jgi:hypothetical protein
MVSVGLFTSFKALLRRRQSIVGTAKFVHMTRYRAIWFYQRGTLFSRHFFWHGRTSFAIYGTMGVTTNYTKNWTSLKLLFEIFPSTPSRRCTPADDETVEALTNSEPKKGRTGDESTKSGRHRLCITPPTRSPTAHESHSSSRIAYLRPHVTVQTHNRAQGVTFLTTSVRFNVT